MGKIKKVTKITEGVMLGSALVFLASCAVYDFITSLDEMKPVEVAKEKLLGKTEQHHPSGKVRRKKHRQRNHN